MSEKKNIDRLFQEKFKEKERYCHSGSGWPVLPLF
jgi:hypothetical protein